MFWHNVIFYAGEQTDNFLTVSKTTPPCHHSSRTSIYQALAFIVMCYAFMLMAKATDKDLLAHHSAPYI